MSPNPRVASRALPTHRALHATPALNASVLLAVVLPLAAVVLHRPALALLAAPFITHALRALLHRPVVHAPDQDAAGQDAPDTTLRLAPIPGTVGEGQAVQLSVEGAPDELVTLALTPAQLQHLRPGPGVSTGAGGAVVQVEPVRWGRHRIGPGIVVAEDASGAWRRTGTVEPLQLRVRPSSELMVGGSGVKQPLGVHGEHLSARRGEGTELAEVRQYRPGDRLRRVNWRISSRTDELHVTEAHTERDTDVLVLLDSLNPALELGKEPESSLDIGVRATLALARHYLGFGDRLGVHDLGHRVGDLPLGTGPRQLVGLNEVLSHAGRDHSTTRQPGLRPVRTPRAGTLVFVCSPLLDDDVLTEIGRLRGLGVELVVVDTLPPSLGTSRSSVPREQTKGLAEAWMLRRLERQAVLERLQAVGIPVTAWHGPASLAGVLQAMEQARHAPRMVRR